MKQLFPDGNRSEWLRPGTNVFAVEIHQAARNSSISPPISNYWAQRSGADTAEPLLELAGQTIKLVGRSVRRSTLYSAPELGPNTVWSVRAVWCRRRTANIK
jgi:hypothetical protein